MADREELGRQWRETWGAFGLAPPAGLCEELVARWDEPHRAYHTSAHLARCLTVLEEVRAAAERLPEVQLALWFHDAIYDPRAQDNEARSAAWALGALAGAGVHSEVGQRVAAAILATRHQAVPAPGDQALVVDVDLAILGAPPAEYDAYARAVRAEYAWVTEPAFRAGRAGVLRGFLARSRIYGTHALGSRLEAPARVNLTRELAALA